MKIFIKRVSIIFSLAFMTMVLGFNSTTSKAMGVENWYSIAAVGTDASSYSYVSTNPSNPYNCATSTITNVTPSSTTVGSTAVFYFWYPYQSMPYISSSVVANTPTTDYRTISITDVTGQNGVKSIANYKCYKISISAKKVTSSGIDCRLNNSSGTRICTFTGLLIAKGTATLNKPTINTNLTYNGQNQVIVNGGSGVNGTICVAVNGSNVSYSGKYLAKNSGSYTITAYAKATDTENYNNSATVTVGTATIIPKEVSLSCNILKKEYDGTILTPKITASGICSGDTCTISNTSTSSNQAGIYKISDLKLSNSNYKLPTDHTFTVTIEQREARLKWSNIQKTYDGKALIPKCEVDNLVNGDKCDVTIEAVPSVKVGEYTIKAIALSNSNYKLPDNASCKVVINKNTINNTSNDSDSNNTTLNNASLNGNTTTNITQKLRIKWKKVKYKKNNCKKYIIYQKKAGKWIKIKTAKKNTTTVTMIKGSKLKIKAMFKVKKKWKCIKKLYKYKVVKKKSKATTSNYVTLKITAGKTKTITLKNVSKKTKVTWTIKNKRIARIKLKSKNKLQIKAKKVGTTKIICKVKKQKIRLKVKVVKKKNNEQTIQS